MSDRSVKELFDEITSLDRIELDMLLRWYENKLGVPEERSVRPRAVLDDRAFVSGYDITVTGYTPSKKVLAVKKLREFWAFSLTEAVAFLDDLPKTIYELHPKDDALEIRRKYLEAGMTVELKWRSGYIPSHEFFHYNEHQQYQLMNLPPEPDL